MSTFSSSPSLGPHRSTGRLALAVGFLAVAVGTYIAYRNPATGYEVSLYTESPLAYWVCIAFALLLAIAMVFFTDERDLSALLAGLAFATVLGLPLLRGYFFYGPADSLTHLGWMRDMLAGTLDPGAFLYPGLHTASLLIAEVTTLPLTIAMLIVVFTASTTFVTTVPMAVVAMTDSRRVAGVAVLAGILFLPIRHISLRYMEPMPISDTILLFPLGLYLLARYLTSRQPTERRPTAIGAVLATYLLGVVLFHPLQALSVLIFLAPITLVQFVAGRRLPDSRIAQHRPLYGQTAFLAVTFIAWSLSRSRAQRAYETVVSEFFGLFVPTSGAEPAEIVQQRTGGLEAIGVSPIEIFAKLFLASAAFAGIVAVVSLLIVAARLRATDDIAQSSGVVARLIKRLPTAGLATDQTSTAMLTYLSAGVVALVPFSIVLLLAGDASDLFFRALGAIMAVVTVYGGIALVRWGGVGELASGITLRRALVALCIAVLLVQTVTVVFASPHVYKPNRQVSEQIYTGHETLFDHYDEEIPILGLRQAPWRYHHAIYGVETPPGQDYQYRWSGQRIFPEQTGALSGEFGGDRYLTVTQSIRLRETVAFREVRYSRSALAEIEGQPGVGRVQSNGEFTTYYIDEGTTEPQGRLTTRTVPLR